ncbi:Gfo/Idh/MocA family oxidoreductase [Actinospica sp.]|uniref:Gfo/Idh/MocA family protein n=1 Tax=Actinospica sp. TaxID=1872142 RepID=UPI002CE77FFB|nr:Gfo/Idh/MocA family oxidoreductase [Actinospica sp.]HWG24193.1 Gfo/Idh/MocA family oxidoreductase [Actinospica sp.]
MSARTIGIGLISVGWMGRAHSRAYRNVNEHYPELAVRPELVAAADLVESNRADAVDVLGYRRSVADFREVLADPEVDAVSICAPNFLHHEMALAAAAAGKPFWIEKPMGRGLAESDAIARAAAKAGVVTAVGFNYRNPPAVAKARELIASGRLGRVTNVRVSFLADYSSSPDGALMWRFIRDQAGSGVYGDLLSHGFDLATYLVGPIREVSAAQDTYITERPSLTGTAIGHNATATGEPGPVENEDYAAVLARFENGALGVFEASRIAVGPRAEYVVEVYGTEGSLRWDFQRLNELRLAIRGDRDYGYTTLHAQPGDGDFARFQPGGGTSMGFDDLKTIEAERFLRSIAEGVQHGPSVADGRAAAAIADAAERSGRLREWVAVD